MLHIEFWAVIVLCIVQYTAADHETGGGHKAACINGADHVTTPLSTRRIDQLKIGDYVAVAKNQFEPIITFLHRDDSRNAPGFRLVTANDNNVTLSDEHLVFIAPDRKAILAKNVKVGHRLYSATSEGFTEEEVVGVERSEVEGRYSPLTPSGVILVNDVLVSCYSQIEDHSLMHRIVNWLLPIVSSEAIFGSDASLTRADGMHSVGSALWHHFRHWFIAGSG